MLAAVPSAASRFFPFTAANARAAGDTAVTHLASRGPGTCQRIWKSNESRSNDYMRSLK